MTVSSSFLSTSEQTYILEGCRDNVRLDGRKRGELRPFTILKESNPLVTSNGSSRIMVGGTNGGTHVLCSVKAELVHPSPVEPDKGAVEIHIDSLGSSSSAPQVGTSSHRLRRLQEQQLQSTLMSLMEKHIVHLQGLVAVSGLYVWKLNIDLVVLSDKQGCLLDVCSRAIRAAIQNTRLPHMVVLNHDPEQGSSSSSKSTTRGGAQVDLAVDGDIQKAVLPAGVDDCPIIVTVSILKCPPKGMSVLVLDTTLEEEACASSQVHVVVRPGGVVVGCLGLGLGGLGLGMLPEVTSTAVQSSKQVFAEMNKVLSRDLTTPQSLLQEHFQVR